MGLIDKNYLNKLSQQVKNELNKQPCGCDCNCRPKFEESGTPPTPPLCNCRIDVPSQIVGSWQDGRGSFPTPLLTLDIVGGQNCPMTIQFAWDTSNYNGVVVLKTATQIIPMTQGVFYTITLNPGDWFFFNFTYTPDIFDQYLTIQCINDTCAENYGQVGDFTGFAI